MSLAKGPAVKGGGDRELESRPRRRNQEKGSEEDTETLRTDCPQAVFPVTKAAEQKGRTERRGRGVWPLDSAKWRSLAVLTREG